MMFALENLFGYRLYDVRTTSKADRLQRRPPLAVLRGREYANAHSLIRTPARQITRLVSGPGHPPRSNLHWSPHPKFSPEPQQTSRLPFCFMDYIPEHHIGVKLNT
jgi:hypothetical protein